METFLIPVVMLFVLLWKCKGTKNWHEDFMDYHTSKGLLGVCAVLIILHHISQALVEKAVGILFLHDIGVLFVGFFFFYSGYGLYKSLRDKPDYLKGYFKKRYGKILVPFYLVILIFFITALVDKTAPKGSEMIAFLFGWKLLNTHMWYIVEIAVLYLLFFAVFRFIKNQKLAIGIFALLVAGMTCGSLLLGHGDYWFQGEWWYNTTFTFVIGILFAYKEEKLVPIMKKAYVVLLVALAVLTIGLGVLTDYCLKTYSYWSEYWVGGPGYADKFRCLGAQLPMVIVFVLMFVMLTMKVKFSNGIMDFLGKISLELYLIHNLFLQKFLSLELLAKNSLLYIVAVVAASVISAWLLHELIELVTGKKHNRAKVS